MVSGERQDTPYLEQSTQCLTQILEKACSSDAQESRKLTSTRSGIFGYINYLVEKDRKQILDTLVNGQCQTVLDDQSSEPRGATGLTHLSFRIGSP